jgi:Cd2+/Zn2+-exporting ATPase
MTPKQKKSLYRILISTGLLILAVLLPATKTWKLLLYLVPYLLIGYDVLWEALCNLAHGKVFDENFLMGVATISALSIGQCPEAVAVMLFFQVGELFEDLAVEHSRKNIGQLMDIRSDRANLEKEDGSVVSIHPKEVPVGSILLIRPGERIPLDGIVLDGRSLLDTSALTGESIPREVLAGSEVLSGCINQSGVLHIVTTKEFATSTASKILDLVENSSAKKAKAENFIAKFSRYYTPIVVFAAVALAVLPPLLLQQPFQEWFTRALNFLVVSCPCALVISIPLSFFGGIGGASHCGILIKGGNYMEALAKTEIAVFDKTGTLTKGSFHVVQILPSGSISKSALLETAALAESGSSHPIALSLRNAWGKEITPGRVSEIQELAGHGVRAKVDGHTVLVGSRKLMRQEGIPCQEVSQPGSAVYVAADNVYLGCLIIADEVKPDAAETMAALKSSGVKRTVMLTGDNPSAAKTVADQIGIDEVQAGLLPNDKVDAVEKLMQEKQGSLVFVGDGINDAPVLARADVGIAMGALGSDAAIEAADIVLMDDKPSKLATAIRISRRTLRIVHQNIIFAIAVKLIVLILSALGIADMWAAVFADVGVSILAILNAMRVLYGKGNSIS